jgi:hypothetical protein
MVAELDKVRAELVLVGLLLLGACDRPHPDNGGGRSAVGVVDSILPPEEALRRFREGMVAPAVLDGPRSRDELLERFMIAVKNRDVAALRTLGVSRPEYAYLVYPELPISRPPYRQPPNIAWLLLETSSNASVNKLVTTAASRFELLGYDCPSRRVPHGPLGLTNGCTIRVREGSTERPVRLFRSIVDRGGRWKFLSLDGDL